MESMNLIKGYGKINQLEARSDPPPNRRRAIIAAASLAVILTLLVASLVAAVIYESVTESEESESSGESLKTVCAVTRYPASCLSSISPLNAPPSNNPLTFFNLSLHAGLVEVSDLKDRVSGSDADPAVKDCGELFDDAASQLGRSAESICVGIGEKVLTEARIGDLNTWISAAMTDQETCLDGLSEMGSTALGELRVRVQRSQEYMSNTLAILNNIQSLFKKLGLTMP